MVKNLQKGNPVHYFYITKAKSLFRKLNAERNKQQPIERRALQKPETL